MNALALLILCIFVSVERCTDWVTSARMSQWGEQKISEQISCVPNVVSNALTFHDLFKIQTQNRLNFRSPVRANSIDSGIFIDWNDMISSFLFSIMHTFMQPPHLNWFDAEMNRNWKKAKSFDEYEIQIIFGTVNAVDYFQCTSSPHAIPGKHLNRFKLKIVWNVARCRHNKYAGDRYNSWLARCECEADHNQQSNESQVGEVRRRLFELHLQHCKRDRDKLDVLSSDRQVDFNHTVPGENKSRMKMHKFLICSSVTFYFHSLTITIERASAMPTEMWSNRTRLYLLCILITLTKWSVACGRVPVFAWSPIESTRPTPLHTVY